MWLKIFILSLIVTTSSAASELIRPKAVAVSSANILDIFKDNITSAADFINGVLKSLSVNEYEGNIISYKNIEQKEFEKSLTFLFKTTIETNWQMKHFLQEIAAAANDVTVYEILYKTLFQELRSDPNKRNPYLYIELYKDLEYVLVNVTSEKLLKLHKEIEMDVVKCCAQVLKSYFIQKSTIQQLLAQLKQTGNNLYSTTIPLVFENLNSIEDQSMIAEHLLDFDSQTQEAVLNHIAFIQYLQFHAKVIPSRLYENFELLLARPDFVNISASQRQKSAELLPVSIGNLFAAQKICIRNSTTNLYLHECPQTYLMCTNIIANNTNPINRKKAAFEIERIGNDLYTFFSPHWSRYLHLQMGNTKNTSISSTTNPRNSTNSTTVLKIIKNLYSHVEASSWFIKFHGDYATIRHTTGNFYVCGGNPLYWSNMEKHTYTRQSVISYEIQNECFWLLEDCSDVN